MRPICQWLTASVEGWWLKYMSLEKPSLDFMRYFFKGILKTYLYS